MPGIDEWLLFAQYKPIEAFYHDAMWVSHRPA